MNEELGWLIETGNHCYWSGRHANADGFTHDPNDAVRFARFEDSERVIFWLMENYKVFLCSRLHKWVDGCALAAKGVAGEKAGITQPREARTPPSLLPPGGEGPTQV